MNIELRPPSRSNRNLIRRMMELYLYDFSEYDDADLDEHGLFAYGDLDYFWFEPTHAAYLVTVDGKLAGFALVDNDVKLTDSERAITEFFVMRKYRRRGVGKQVAHQLFDLLPARWEMAVLETNKPAQQFWRKTLGAYRQGNFQETALNDDEWQGPVFSLDNRPL
ncbi:MAG: GNAT family N-acetyltransferase [Anaerolinea sp.]|nr:GNAT family N-acetyltransferase [Anaerolinea sp.]